MKESPKWKTTIIGILGVVLTILNVWKPDFFDVEMNALITDSVNALMGLALSWVAIFSARDESKIDNVK